MGDAGGPGSARKCSGVALADLGDAEGFKKVGKRASCTLSSCPTGCTNEKRSPPKREVGRRSSVSWATSTSHMPSPDGSTSLRLLGAGGSPSRTPFKKRAGWSTFESPLPTSQRGSSTRFERWQIAVPGCVSTFLRPKTWSFRAVHAENEQQPGGNSKNGVRVLSSGTHRHGNTYINNPSRGDPWRPARRLRRSFARLQAQVDQCARAKRTWGLHRSSGATCSALYLGGIQQEAEHRFLDISKIHVGPVELKRLRFTPAGLTPDQSSVVFGAFELVRQCW